MGTVRFYFKKDAVLGENGRMNATYNNGYQPQNMMIYSKKDFKMEKNSLLAGFIYSDDELIIGENSIVHGSISTKDAKLEQSARVYYTQDAIVNTDFGGYCVTTSLHHYEIIHDGAASSCDSETVTVRACANADCSSLYSAAVSVDLQGDGSTLESLSFTGSTTASFSHTTEETLTLSLANQSQAADNALECSNGNGSGSSCDIVVSAVGCPVAGSCAAVFPDGLNNSDAGGKIKFEHTGRLTSNNDIFLTTQLVEHKGNSTATTCETALCQASGTLASTATSSYTSYTSGTNFKADGTTRTITGSDFKDVEVKNSGTLNMDPTITTYTFKKLKAKSGGILNLTPGDYFVTEFEVNNATMNVVGSGTVRVWSTNKLKLKESATVNGGASGDPAKLFMYFFANDDQKVKIESGSYSAGYIYSANKVEVKGSSKFYGAITAVGELKVKDSAEVITKTNTIDDGDFGVACSTTMASVDHYQFEYAGNGLTCQTQAITISACGNASCSELYSDPVSLDLTATTASTNQTVNLSFSQSTTVNIAEIVPGNVTLTMNNASPMASLTCKEDGMTGADCIYELKDTGFIFIDNSDGDTDDFPTQIAGKPSDVGFNAHTISLKAVQTDTSTGACASLFSESATVSVDMAYQCTDPGACTTNPASITNDGNTANMSVYPSYSSHNLLFGADSSATMALTYHDVGKIKLYAQKSIVLDASHTAVLNGNTPDILVRPFALRMTVADNPAALDASGNIFKKAGESFSVQVDAIAWQSGEDSNSDGFSDVGDDLSDNPVVKNFGQENSAESVVLTSSIVSPSGGTNGTLANANFASFANGSQARSDVSWNEVGVMALTATNVGYLDSGVSINTTHAAVGRFVPDHFTLVSSSMSSGCTSHFMGKDFTLLANIEARGADETVMTNYSSGVGNDFHAKASATLVAENGNNGVDLGARVNGINMSWTSGVSDDSYTTNFTRLTTKTNPTDLWMDGPFDNSFVGLQIDDGEPLASLNFATGFNMRADTSSDCIALGNCNAISFNTVAQKIRYSRLNSSEVFGPQSENLTLPLSIEYWDGTKFALSDDSCVSLPVSAFTIANVQNATLTNSYDVLDPSSASDVGDTSVVTSAKTTTTTLTAENGYFDLTLTAPSFSVTGQTSGVVPVSIDLTSFPWLQFDWSTNGTGDNETELPTQNISFGQYRGNDRVIYWREKR